MIKALKVNFYQFFRSKVFYVTTILLVVGAILMGFLIKFIVDDPSGIVGIIRQELEKSAVTDNEDYELGYRIGMEFAQAADPNSADIQISQEEMEAEMKKQEEENSSSRLALTYIDSISKMNSMYGILDLNLGAEGSYILMCIFVALFTGNTFKSRYHVNFYSLNLRPGSIVASQLFSFASLFVILETICCLITFALTCCLCSSFNYSFDKKFFMHLTIYVFVGFAYMMFSYMIAFFRRGPILSIILSCLCLSGIIDFFTSIAGVFYSPLKYLSPNYGLNSIAAGMDISMIKFSATIASLLTYTLVVSGITFLVANKRDAY